MNECGKSWLSLVHVIRRSGKSISISLVLERESNKRWRLTAEPG